MPAATATILGAGALLSSAVGAGMSFAQASKQQEAQKKAEQAAEKAMAEAKAKLDVNYFDQLGINKLPYEYEREALAASGAQALEAARESDRGAAAAAGRIQMAQQEAQKDITSRMSQEMSQLEQMATQEDARLAQAQANLALGEAEGAQQAAAYSEQARQQAIMQGISSIGDMATTAAGFVPLYGTTKTPTAKTTTPPVSQKYGK